MSARAFAAGLLLALALWAGEAAAQTVCRGGAHTGGGIIVCVEGAGSNNNVLVNPGSVNITGYTDNDRGIRVDHDGSGNAEIRMTAGRVVTLGRQADGMRIQRRGTGGSIIRMSGGSVETRGALSRLLYINRLAGAGDIGIYMTGGSLSSQGQSGGGLTASIGLAAGTSGNITVGSISESYVRMV